ncbi:mineralocorticoid receptor-like [Entelurus aequoreus]|uniref:mineralocorticoid receptor-like n=2 Tax=Entelurus aequoreus TaxID=161455 RepID=UPI002B1CE92C|nr:mineralocorticoid receptor-like [Entelurus aequoreus]XP_061888355.1 mineralocorticoid receptor-like [Entelurus aequoreus]XP_061888357.1 mineralocorticoid receptor-like [Entelurus aequoreus]XP_061888358.1 mineralocorticoid receptor-like [Entelurus aequoreus]
METKRYQSFFDGSSTENRWSQIPGTTEFCCTPEDLSLSGGDILMDIVSADAKDAKEPEQQPPLRPGQNQQLAPLHFSNPLHGHKPEMDSKELSKTVAESMGLYMNAAREADFAFSQHGGGTSPRKMQYPGCGRPLEENPAKSPKLRPFKFQQPSNTQRESAPGTPVGSSSVLASSSPGGGNNMVSSTTSPPACFGPSSVTSPVSHTACAQTLANIKRRNSAACSPVESSTVGSPPLASPLGVLRSPMSSPQSMSSVRSPPSCSTACNMRSSVSSPTSTVRPPASSPATGATMDIGSPQNPSSGGFPASSPASELGLVQNDRHSPEAAGLTADPDFKPFEFPKVEMEDGEVFNVGLDQMGMVKYIKNEPGTDFRSMCLGGSKCNTASTPFVTQIKNERDKNEGCMNPQSYSAPSPPLGLYPASETTYLSLRNNIDEYSLSGILGPPVSMNGNYDSDVFSNNVLSKAVKQESSDAGYYQESTGGPTSAIVGVNSGGHSFHYQIGAQGTMSFRDQPNPLLNLISPVAALMESWKSRPGMPQGSLSGRGEAYPGQNCIVDGMSSSPLRQPSSTAKVCLVCGDEASGCHYGVVTCGSCKVFFKRAVEGQHNYLCAGRNDCIIDKIRRKNCPACRVRKCLQAGMNLGARKSKKLVKLKGVSEDSQGAKEAQTGGVGGDFLPSEKELNASASTTLVPHGAGVVTPFLPPSICSVLELIEPEEVYSGFDNTQPDTTDHLLSSLNCLAGKQMVRLVKWAKVLPGFRGLPIEDQITLIQYSWMCLSSFCLSWRSYKHTNGQMLYFAPDLIFNEERMQQSAMYHLCLGMRQVSQEFVRLQLTYDEFLSMKVLLLLSTIPKEGLKNQAAFEEMRVNYIKELRRSVGKATNNSGQTWQRFFQLTKLLDAMHHLVGNLLDFCFYTFRESQALKVEFPDMLVEIISDQIPKVESGLTHTIYFHKK